MKPASPIRTRLSDAASAAPRAARDVALAIPAYAPPKTLIDLVDALSDAGVPAILLVDDGSPAAWVPLFELLASNPRVHLLQHPRNYGKGAALKTAFAYFLDHLSHLKGVVTADADGQHAVDDILRVTWSLHRSTGAAIIGARRFDLEVLPPGERAPLRNVLGNVIISGLFRWMTGLPLEDSQCGLRGLPSGFLSALRDLPGERYEYEMAMLMWIARANMQLAEQPIRTIYRDRNSNSNFRPVRDSLRVLRALLRSPRQQTVALPGAGLADSRAGRPEQSTHNGRVARTP
jgi:glycosyltransferase involved in cell wall biosynthesis